MSLTRVGILSDIHLFSEAIARVLTAEASLQLIEIPNPAALTATPQGTRLHVLLLDARQPDALALCRRLRSSLDLKIVALAVPADGPLAADALLAGALG